MILGSLPPGSWLMEEIFCFNQREHVTPASHGEGTQSSSHSFTWVGLDQGRPQSGPDLLLYKRCETVMFEKFALLGGKLRKNVQSSPSTPPSPRANEICKLLLGGV